MGGGLTTFRFSVFSLPGPLQPPPPILTHKHTKSLARTHTHTHIPTRSAKTVCEQTTGRERKRKPSLILITAEEWRLLLLLLLPLHMHTDARTHVDTCVQATHKRSLNNDKKKMFFLMPVTHCANVALQNMHDTTLCEGRQNLNN